MLGGHTRRQRSYDGHRRDGDGEGWRRGKGRFLFLRLLLAVRGVTTGDNERLKERVWFVVLLVGDVAA